MIVDLPSSVATAVASISMNTSALATVASLGVGLFGVSLALRKALACRSKKTVSSIVAGLEKTKTQLEDHALDKLNESDRHQNLANDHLTKRDDAADEHAKAIAVAANIGQLVGFRS